jgi:myo-inositol-1(or 4)-monophosphatase
MSVFLDADPRFAVARAATLDAGATALEYFRNVNSLKIEQKANEQDLVSIADRTVEKHFRERIFREFPDDGILGEEEGLQNGTSGTVWVVDPIDGTNPFLRGMREWAVSVAALTNGVLQFGLVYVPANDELYYAVKGNGAFLNEEPIHVDTRRTLKSATIGVGMNPHVPPGALPHFLGMLTAEGAQFFRCGSAAVTLSYVACGRLLGYYETIINSWDCMAGLCLIREAGGWTAGFGADDPPEVPMPIAAGAPQIRDDLLRIIKASRRDFGLPEFTIKA